ncbi:hypothetical protein GDO81_018674 [Engystomops pustulosus]|uniref:Uncharacterized protein n=1 Tax=Engystomops pustulosus TaxID=76066 RepID=A0AAV6YB03_ENGPU|nr:hypothetical protein GDO81_018674 [Engystomops pustulosus]
MRWTINGGKVETYDLEIHNQTNGLYQVRSRILLKRSSDGHVYGAVRHPVTGKEVGVHMKIADDVFPRLSSWLFAFVFILVILTAGAIFSSLYIWKQKSQRGGT